MREKNHTFIRKTVKCMRTYTKGGIYKKWKYKFMGKTPQKIKRKINYCYNFFVIFFSSSLS